ncbi:MAG: PKD domain-containing protein, partial [Gammaproteobacteria bacterium]
TTVEVVVTPGNETVAILTIDGESSGPAPLSVRLDGSRSVAADGRQIVSYRFDFGDGTAPVQGTQPTVTPVYTVPGTYQPTLTVTDDQGGTSVAKAEAVEVSGSTPGTDGGNAGSGGRRGGGALGWIALLPLLLAARRRRQE